MLCVCFGYYLFLEFLNLASLTKALHWRSANRTYCSSDIPKNILVFFSFSIFVTFSLLYLTSPIRLLHFISSPVERSFHLLSQNHLSSLLNRKRNTPFLILSQTKPAVCFYIVKRKLGERRGKKDGQGNEVCSNMGRGSTKAYCVSQETTTTILKLAKA